MANIIQQMQMPALVMAHNKTLAAQLYAEFKEFFPDNAVEYFVSYYDYYQPEAYVPPHDLYIEKETEINEEIDRLRLAATTALMSRRDVIIVASVSCIYGLGQPGDLRENGDQPGSRRRSTAATRCCASWSRASTSAMIWSCARALSACAAIRLEIFPAYEDRKVFRISFFGDEVERIMELNPVTGEVYSEPQQVDIFPAKHYITEEQRLKKAIADIEAELEDRS